MSKNRRGTGAMRWLRISLRTVHIIGTSFLVGGHAFGAASDALLPWLIVVVGSGAALIATYLAEGLLWFREVRGAAVLFKSALLLLIPVWWHTRVPILVAVIVIGSIVSHMPGRYRYWVLGRGPRSD